LRERDTRQQRGSRDAGNGIFGQHIGSPHFRNAGGKPVTSTSVPRIPHGTGAPHCGQKPPQ
jgi:hypothetical protein